MTDRGLFLRVEMDLEVEEAVESMLHNAGVVMERLASPALSEADDETIDEAVAAFHARLASLHSLLDDKICRTLGGDVPLRNHSYKEREELELVLLKAKHVLELL